jgi:NAD(P)-dependent dehydrogenase (short-subunit alcohol dehydrogenase family)
VAALGPLTVMVANAGIAQVASTLDLEASDVTALFAVNFLGVFNCYTEAARQMITQGPAPEESSGYKIIGASSIAAFKPFPTLAHYCASKAAVRVFTQTFAIEMARHQINVNCYAPGIVGTAKWELVDEKLGEIEGRPKGESLKKYSTDLTAMGRVSVPDDVAKVVGGFLCGYDSAFVTGQTIVVDGGIVFT